MAKLFLLLGGNLGNKKVIFESVLSSLAEKVGMIENCSSVYETEPWGFQSDDLFWNQVIIMETNLSPEDALASTKQIEQILGRVRKEDRYSSRIIDIDLLFYNDLIYQTSGLELPHPRLAERRFVLAPLAEIAPDLIHPVLQKPVWQMLEECPDHLGVKKLEQG